MMAALLVALVKTSPGTSTSSSSMVSSVIYAFGKRTTPSKNENILENKKHICSL